LDGSITNKGGFHLSITSNFNQIQHHYR